MLIEHLPKVQGKYRSNVNLGKTSWFQVGGNAEVVFKPYDTKDLAFFLKNKGKNINIEVLGLASNVIIRDNGLEGVLIRLGKNFTDINIDQNIVEVGCAVIDCNLAKFLCEHKLSGLEFLVGVPGNIGGAVAMNSGCYGSEIADYLIDVEAINKFTGKIHKLSNKELGFGYRCNDLREEFVFTKARFKLTSVKSQEIARNKINEIAMKRELSQPIKEKTGGSTFKNLYNKKAWELIDGAGLRGYSYGKAKFSEKHCNFLINTGDANAKELETLGKIAIERVYQQYKVKLEWEIKRIGLK